MAEVTEKPRACVEARDGDFLLPSFSADGTGSVSPGVDLSVEIEKPIHEAR